MGWEGVEGRGRGTMKRIGGRRGMLFLFIVKFEERSGDSGKMKGMELTPNYL